MVCMYLLEWIIGYWNWYRALLLGFALSLVQDLVQRLGRIGRANFVAGAPSAVPLPVPWFAVADVLRVCCGCHGGSEEGIRQSR